MLALYSVLALVVGQAPVQMRNSASQSAVPAQPTGAIWINQVGAGPLALMGLAP